MQQNVIEAIIFPFNFANADKATIRNAKHKAITETIVPATYIAALVHHGGFLPEKIPAWVDASVESKKRPVDASRV